MQGVKLVKCGELEDFDIEMRNGGGGGLWNRGVRAVGEGL